MMLHKIRIILLSYLFLLASVITPSNWRCLNVTPNVVYAHSDVPVYSDYDFNQFKAIAMVCDNGATLPISSVQGQWFLHTPTGRNILYMYNGSNWRSIISLSSMTVYVDNTDGTDSLDKGGSVDSGAFKTVQFAVDVIPGLVGGNVVINSNGETYREEVTIQGKNFTGNYTIKIIGAKTDDFTGTATAAANLGGNGAAGWGTLTDSGSGWTVNAYRNKFIEITGGTGSGQIRVIDANTSEVITIVGRWDTVPSTDSTFVVYTIDTVITAADVADETVAVRDSAIIVTNGQKGIELQRIILFGGKTVNEDGAVLVEKFSNCNVWYCYIRTSFEGIFVNAWSTADIRHNIVDGNFATGTFGVYTLSSAIPVLRGNRIFDHANRNIIIGDNSIINLYENRFTNCSIWGFSIATGAIATFEGYNEIDNNGNDGVQILVDGTTSATTTHGAIATNVIKDNGDWGLDATEQSLGRLANSMTYSGNASGTTNSDATSLIT
jgi:hypothetical protein